MSRSLTQVVGFVKSEWVALLILIGAFSAATYHLTEAPATWYDEGMIEQLALTLERYGHIGIQLAPGVFASGALTSTGFPLVAPLALSFLVFGASLASARAVMVIYILVFLVASYLLARRLFPKNEALYALALLATFPTLYGDGKNVLGEVPGLTFLILFLYFAQRFFGEGKRTWVNAALAGLFLGLAIATKPTFLVLGGAVLVGLFYTLGIRRERPPLSLLLVTAVATLVPILVWLLTQFSPHDSLSQVLSFYSNPYRLTGLGSVLFHNALRFITEFTPLVLFAQLLLWMLWMCVRLRKRKPLSFVEITAFTFVLLILAAYLRTPGWYRYFFPAQMVVMLFVPAALFGLCRALPNERVRRAMIRFIPVALYVLIALQLYWLFFDSWVSQYYHSDTTQQMEAYFVQVSPNTSFFVYDVPESVIFLPPAAPYDQYLSVNGGGYLQLGADQLATVASDTPDEIIVSDPVSTTTEALFPGYAPVRRVGKIDLLERSTP